MLNDLPDHPVVYNMERTGYPDGKEPRQPHCPVCGSETDIFYKNIDGDIFGCDVCVTSSDAWEETCDECY